MGGRQVVIGIGMIVLAGCAGVSPSQVGQTAGSIAGAAIAPGVGMPLGALLGTLAGVLVEHRIDEVREQKERVDLSRELGRPAAPTTASQTTQAGRPTRVWVDEYLAQGRLIPGHFESRFLP